MGETWGPFNYSLGTIYVMGKNKEERIEYLEKHKNNLGFYIYGDHVIYGILEKGEFMYLPFDVFCDINYLTHHSSIQEELNALINWNYAIKNYPKYVDELKSIITLPSELNEYLADLRDKIFLFSKSDLVIILNILENLVILEKELPDKFEERNSLLTELYNHGFEFIDYNGEKIIEINGKYTSIISESETLQWVVTRSTYRFFKSVIPQVLSPEQKK